MKSAVLALKQPLESSAVRVSIESLALRKIFYKKRRSRRQLTFIGTSGGSAAPLFKLSFVFYSFGFHLVLELGFQNTKKSLIRKSKGRKKPPHQLLGFPVSCNISGNHLGIYIIRLLGNCLVLRRFILKYPIEKPFSCKKEMGGNNRRNERESCRP